MFRLLKRKISQNKYFWKFRHLIPSIKKNSDSKSKVINKIFFEIINQNNVVSIMDFGFGKGELLKEMYSKQKNIKFFFGVDINSQNIKNIKKTIKNPNTYFCERFDKNFLKKLEEFSIKKIDLVVFDRVLYIFSDEELKNLLKSITKVASNIFIDDFYKIPSFNSEYIHRDWVSIFKEYNFQVKINIDSINGNPEGCHAKTLLFSK